MTSRKTGGRPTGNAILNASEKIYKWLENIEGYKTLAKYWSRLLMTSDRYRNVITTKETAEYILNDK